MLDADPTGDLANLVAVRVESAALTPPRSISASISDTVRLHARVGRGRHRDGHDAAVAVAERLAVRRALGVRAALFWLSVSCDRGCGVSCRLGLYGRDGRRDSRLRHRRISFCRDPPRLRGAGPLRPAQLGDRVRHDFGLQPSCRCRGYPADARAALNPDRQRHRRSENNTILAASWISRGPRNVPVIRPKLVFVTTVFGVPKWVRLNAL